MRTILFLVRKELIQVFRDPLMPRMIVAAPLVMLFILANAMTFEVKQSDLALVDLDRTSASRNLIQRFVSTGRFRVSVQTPSGDVADTAILTRDANLVLRIPAGFERDLRRGVSPQVQLILNAEDGAAAGVVLSYAHAIIGEFGREWSQSSTMHAAAAGASRGLTVETRKLYNPTGAYRDYMAIGLLAALLTLIGVLLTALNIAREKEIGTLEQLNATPITRTQFILGKLIPFWVLGLLELTIGLLVIRFGFGVEFLGNPLVVYVAAALYLAAALSLGLLISTTANTQQQALFVTYFTIVCFIFLGGIFTPAQSMPAWAQVVAEFNPIKHFVVVLRAVLLKGAGFGTVTRELAAMTAFAAVVLPVALLRYRKTAE